MGGVRVLLDESILLAEDEGTNPSLRSGSEALLRRLRFSKLCVAFCHQEDIPASKADFLTKTAALYSFNCISLLTSHVDNSLNELFQDRSRTGDLCVYVTSKIDEILFSELQNHNWRIILVGLGKCNGGATDKEVLFIDTLDGLLITICRLIKKQEICDKSVLAVGYVMKPSREEDFAKRGAFPSCPTENGLIFVPLIFELPLASQLQGVDVILHKVTDEIISIDTNSSFNFPKGISFTTGMSELQRFLQENSDFCIVDPFSSIYPLLDRLQIQQILLGLQDFGAQCSCRLRAPHFLKVDNFNDPNLGKQLLEAKLNFPVIVKPQVACGVADAHNMALVFKYEDFANLGVPLPAILQEYVDHCSTIFKFYVLGDKVFHAVKKSMPNACVLLSLSEKTGSAPLLFNSLKTLPVAREEQLPIGSSKAIKESLDVGLIEKAANWLRERLGLTIFGFDVVIQEGSGDHVIVDLNYLPSFKEVPDSDALPAFWDAIRKKYELAKLSGQH
ncbi:inositol-tetrakisphosphate 1-kinase 6 isoform X1 [Ananas comosus]|uniref:Inositol-tetrakisphosphate 1-kinase 6 n=1 Tax=Ananas comosus TaxID=4615 RepID=A0A6P5F1I7_ANACO|nr:inositol-tetrakisphosphate 1-kinase 6 isoform X1 [Ananas comosus]